MSIEHLLPFMTRRRFRAGDTLFCKGDPAHEIYYILKGIVRVDGVQRDIGRGQIAGVIGVFAPEKERPWTAVCKTDGELLTVSNEKKVMQAFLRKSAVWHVSGAAHYKTRHRGHVPAALMHFSPAPRQPCHGFAAAGGTTNS
ncbi:Crp/Fnr family transcriptional regulator [Undibacterium arcticum]